MGFDVIGCGSTGEEYDQLAEVLPLMEQRIDALDVATLSALTPEVISRQATINVGALGHVAHGKSKLIEAITGVKPMRFSEEIARNGTKRLGYANAKLYRSQVTGKYCSRGSADPDEFEEDGERWVLQRHISFVDCPGHERLTSTMRNGTVVMDSAIIVVAANVPCPQPQTAEHLAVADILQLPSITVVQNKIDLCTREQAEANRKSIQSFVAGTVAENAPIIPVAALRRANLDIVCEYLCQLPVPQRDFVAPPRLTVIRSFDVNKPGTPTSTLKGGVAGGSLQQGVLRIGDEVELRPGILLGDGTGKVVGYRPIFTKVKSLFAESNALQYAVPGGLIGIGTTMDPTLALSDRLVGSVLGLRGQLPSVFDRIEITYTLLRRLVGANTETGHKKSKQPRVMPLVEGETLRVGIGATTVSAKIISLRQRRRGMEGEGSGSGSGSAVEEPVAVLSLKQPVCCDVGEKVSFYRKSDSSRWRLIGWGVVQRGKDAKVISSGHAVIPEEVSGVSKEDSIEDDDEGSNG